MTRPTNPLTVQRLAFVRFLYEQGLAQADQPEPLSATAILSFHDAVELFLRLAAEHLGINLPTNVNFADYWDKLKPGLPAQTELPSKNAMDRMNRARVALKHHGTIPSSTAVEQARGDVTTFFTDAAALVFSVDFARIDLIDMVARGETAQLLRDAQTHADVGDYVAAMAGLVIAFDDLVDHYAERHGYGSDHPFGFGPTLRDYRSRGPQSGELKHLQQVTQAAIAMQRALRLLALGIDYRRYAQFEILAPRVNGYLDGSTRYIVTKAQEQLTDQDYQTCRRFVIESSLQAAKADAALEARMQHLQINQPEPGTGWTPTERTWTGPA